MFKVLDRYLYWTFFRSLFISIFVFLFIYLIIDNIEHLDDYIDNQAEFGTVVRYYIHFFPFIIVQVTPVAVLLACMFTIGLMARRNELLALNSSGVSLYRTAQPLLLCGLVLSVGMFFFADRVVPQANREKMRILHGEIEKKASYGKEQIRDLYYLGEQGRIFQFESYDLGKLTARGVNIRTVQENRLKNQIDAQMMRWQDSGWVAYHVEYREFQHDSSGVGVENLTEQDTLFLSYLTETPGLFEKSETIRKSSDKNLGFDMSLEDIKRTIEYREKSAMDTTREQVYLQMKYSLPLASFIIVLLAVPLASDPRRGSLAIGFAFSAGITFIYILLFETGQKLGVEGTIPPWAAAWGVNGLFFLAGLVFMLKARK